jgi:hypothetical protein
VRIERAGLGLALQKLLGVDPPCVEDRAASLEIQCHHLRALVEVRDSLWPNLEFAFRLKEFDTCRKSEGARSFASCITAPKA